MGTQITPTGQTTIQIAGPAEKQVVLAPGGSYTWKERLTRGYNQLVGAVQLIAGLGPINLNIYFSPDPVAAGWTLVDTYAVPAATRQAFILDIEDEHVRIEAVDLGGGCTVVLNANLVPISSYQETNPAPIPVNVTLNTLLTTHHNAATVAAVGAVAAVNDHGTALVEIVATSITLATLQFEVTENGVDYLPCQARRVGDGHINTATAITADDIEIWEVPVAGAVGFRVNLTVIVPNTGDVTVTSKMVAGVSANLRPLSVNAGATDNGTARVSSNVSDGAGNPASDADPLPVEVGDGINQLGIAVKQTASPDNGVLGMVEYNAVPDAGADGQTMPRQGNIVGRAESASHDRSTGTERVLEQSPITKNVLRVLVRADAILPAAGAYDAAPIEISTGSRRYMLMVRGYTRGGAAGSFRWRPVDAIRDVGTDYWGQNIIVNSGAFAAGSDVNSQDQAEDFEYTATGATEETTTFLLDLGKADKVRIPCREVGNVAAPGDLWIRGLLFDI